MPLRALLVATLAAAATAAFAGQWPQFRGRGAAGVADGSRLPGTWDAAQGTNLRWKARLPGLAHSSPVV